MPYAARARLGQAGRLAWIRKPWVLPPAAAGHDRAWRGDLDLARAPLFDQAIDNIALHGLQI